MRGMASNGTSSVRLWQARELMSFLRSTPSLSVDEKAMTHSLYLPQYWPFIYEFNNITVMTFPYLPFFQFNPSTREEDATLIFLPTSCLLLVLTNELSRCVAAPTDARVHDVSMAITGARYNTGPSIIPSITRA